MTTKQFGKLDFESKHFTKPMVFTNVNVTPELAKDLLALNSENRPLRSRDIKKYADQMRAGKWMLCTDNIGITEDKVISNGQHRLHAIIQSEVPCVFNIQTGLSKDSFKITDAGKNRTAADTVSLMGYNNATVVASFVKYLIAYDINNDFEKAVSVISTNQDVAAYLELLDQKSSLAFNTSLHKGLSYYAKVKFFGQAGWCLLHSILSRVDPSNAETFLYLLSTGDGVGSTGKDSAIFLLRKRLYDFMVTRGALPVNYKIALCFKAWNYYRTNKEIKNLSWDERQDYPIPQ